MGDSHDGQKIFVRSEHLRNAVLTLFGDKSMTGLMYLVSNKLEAFFALEAITSTTMSKYPDLSKISLSGIRWVTYQDDFGIEYYFREPTGSIRGFKSNFWEVWDKLTGGREHPNRKKILQDVNDYTRELSNMNALMDCFPNGFR